MFVGLGFAVFASGDDISTRPQWSNDSSVVRPMTGKAKSNYVGEEARVSMNENCGPSAVDMWRASADTSCDDDDDGDILARSVDLGGLSLRTSSSFGADIFLRPQSTQTSLRARPSTAAMARRMEPTTVLRSIELFLLSSWGNYEYVGFSGVCGVDSDLEEIELPVPEASYYVYSLDGTASLAKHSPIQYTDNKLLVNGNKLTSKYEDMWVCQTFKGLVVGLRFNLPRSICIKGLRIWNFNAGREDASIGVKHMEISVDRGRRKAVIVRKAPGNCDFDYSQMLLIGGETRGGIINRNTPGRPIFKSANSFGDLESSSEVRSSREKDMPKISSTAFEDCDKKREVCGDFLVDDPPSGTVIVDVDDSDDSDSQWQNPSSPVQGVANDSICRVPQLYETPVR